MVRQESAKLLSPVQIRVSPPECFFQEGNWGIMEILNNIIPLLIGGFIGWLGTLVHQWLNNKQMSNIQKELEGIKSSQHKHSIEFQSLINMTQEIQLSGHKTKLKLYETIIHPVITLIVKLENISYTEEKNYYSLIGEFYPLRMEVLSHLALFAPPDVFISIENILNYLFSVIRDGTTFDLEKIENLGTIALNHMRSDIEIASGEIHFQDFDLIEYDKDYKELASV